MDVLKQKLNDIGSCIGYPFYFFEDGSFSSIFVNGKMNASLVVKGAFAKSDKCFFASAEIAKLSEVKALEKGWTQKSMMPNTVNWFKKYLNDIGTAINYPFYVFDNGAYAKASSLGDKEAVLYVKKPFTSVEGELSFFSSDAQKVLQFNEDLKKVQQRRETQKTELQQIVFRMLACQRVSDKDALLVVENEPHDVVKRCIHSVWKKIGCYLKIVEIYPNSFVSLVKKNWWDIYCFDKQEFKWFCLCSDRMQIFFTLFFQYATPEILKKILRLCLKGNFSYKTLKKHGYGFLKVEASFPRENNWMTERKSSVVDFFAPLCLIDRHDDEAYKVYRKYLSRRYRLCYSEAIGYRYVRERLDVHFDKEFDAIVALGEIDWFKILLDGVQLTTKQKAKLIRTGNIEMIRTYVECCGIDGKFRELLLNSGDDALVALAQVNTLSNTLVRIKHFFGISA